jgi:hemerythrin
MRNLTWTTSEAVWIDEIDDQHKEIFEGVGRFQKCLSQSAPPAETHRVLDGLTTSITEHFAHEERLMRAARYPSLRWHKKLHDDAGRKVTEFVAQIEDGRKGAGHELVEYLGNWLRRHTRVADRMMGAYLRNRMRSIGKLTFRAGTRPAEACAWVDATGNRFDPLARTTSL